MKLIAVCQGSLAPKALALTANGNILFHRRLKIPLELDDRVVDSDSTVSSGDGIRVELAEERIRAEVK